MVSSITDYRPILRDCDNCSNYESEASSSSGSYDALPWYCRVPLPSMHAMSTFFLAFFSTLLFLLGTMLFIKVDNPTAKNVVLMVSDGMGPASLSLTRSFIQYSEGLPFDWQLPLDPYIVGTSRTRSSS